MSTYNDIFIRDSKDETDNTLPREAVTAHSPDIIPWGSSVAPSPGKLFSADYDQDPGRAISYDATNYIYVRGKNYGDSLATATVYLYYAYQTQLSDPKKWQRLSTKQGNNTSVASADTNGIAVTADPFVWKPAKPTPQNPWVLIASIATNDNPNPVPDYDGTDSFADWDAGQGGVAARSIPVPLPPKPRKAYTFSAIVELNNTDAMNIQVGLLPTGGTAGDTVQFSFDTPATGGPISLASAALTGSPGQTFSVNANVPAKYSATVTCEYQAQPGEAIPFPSLTLTIYSVTGGGGGPHGGGSPVLTPLVVYTLGATPAGS